MAKHTLGLSLDVFYHIFYIFAPLSYLFALCPYVFINAYVFPACKTNFLSFYLLILTPETLMAVQNFFVYREISYLTNCVPINNFLNDSTLKLYLCRTVGILSQVKGQIILFG